MSYKIVFMGTPQFAVPPLSALAKVGHDIRGVFTQPSRPRGRGHKEQLTPVHQAALRLGIPVYTPQTLKSEQALSQLRDLQPDVIVVVAYGLILPQSILDIPKHGCINIHASLLPRWRGAAPIQRAILEGDTKTGITIMQMDAGLDSGDILLQRPLPILDSTTASDSHDELSILGAEMIVDALQKLSCGELTPIAQPLEGVSYAAKVNKSEAALDWYKPAHLLLRQIHAFTPWPGAHFTYRDEVIKVLEAVVERTDPPSPMGEKPGTVLDDKLLIACGENALRLTLLQRAGKSKMPAEDFLRGFSIPKGAVLS